MCISLDNRNALFTAKAIKNDELREYANLLATDSMNIRANLLHMAAIMATIASKRDDGILYEFDNSIVTFAEQKLGIKASQTYAMISVGATFLDSDGNCKLPQRGGKWSNTQLMALLPMAGKGKDKKDAAGTLDACKQLVKDGLIKPSMTVAEIKKVVAANKPNAKKVEDKAEDKAEDKVEDKAEDTQKVINGKRLGAIELYKIGDEIHVIVDGKEPSKIDDTFINGIVELLHKSVNYKM